MKKKEPALNGDYMLWRDFRNGDYNAFNRIYNDYYPALLVYGLKFKNDREFVKDCIQELFLDIMRRINKVGDTDNIMFYLLASLRRKILRKIQYDISFRYDRNHPLHNLRLPDQAAEEKVIGMDHYVENKRLVRSLIDKLPPREKEAILLKFYLYLEYDDIASIMGVNVQSVRNLIYRAIKHLRKELHQNNDRVSRTSS